jgi:hypothetical protein
MGQLREFVYCCLTFTLSVLNMSTKHDPLLIVKFEYWNSTYSPFLLNIGSKLDSRQPKELVYCISTYSLSVLNMASNHESRPVFKFVHWQSTYSQSVLNMIMKYGSRKPKNLVLALDQPHVCAKYILETCLAPNEGISVMKLDILPFYTEYELET